MPSKTEEFIALKNEKQLAKQWSELLGKYYNGGGGGYGRVTELTISKVNIYHQAYDGANNYHDIPKSFKPYLEKVIADNLKVLLGWALSELDKDIKLKAAKAHEEVSALLQASLQDEKTT